MSKKHKDASKTLNYIDHFLILASPVNGYFSISTFAFLPSIPIGITSSVIGLKICVIAAVI